jgi:hypothetical protein
MGLLSKIGVLWTSYGPATIFVATTTALLLSPLLRYIIAGWKYKSQDIFHTISDKAKVNYLII